MGTKLQKPLEAGWHVVQYQIPLGGRLASGAVSVMLVVSMCLPMMSALSMLSARAGTSVMPCVNACLSRSIYCSSLASGTTTLNGRDKPWRLPGQAAAGGPARAEYLRGMRAAISCAEDLGNPVYPSFSTSDAG